MRTNYTFLFFTGCKKDLTNSNQSPTDLVLGVHSVNGMLVFDSDSTFNRILQSSLKKSDLQLDMWESRFKDFKSYRRIFLQTKKELDLAESEADFNKVINKSVDLVDIGDLKEGIKSKYSSDLFSRFYNANGIFQIGNRLVIYGKTSVTTTKNLNSSMIKELLVNTSNIESEAVDKKIFFSDKSRIIKTNGTVNYSSIVYGNIFSELKVDGKRRLYMDVYNDYNPSTYRSVIYLKLRQQMKKFFGNWADNETVFVIDDYNWSAFYSNSSVEIMMDHYGSSSSYSSPESYSFYEYFIPQYFGISRFNFNGLFHSRGVPNSDRTIINMISVPNSN